MNVRQLLFACTVLVTSAAAGATASGISVTNPKGSGITIHGNIILKGGSLVIDGSYRDRKECIHSEPGTKWTFRAYEDRAIQYPDYFSTVASSQSKRFNISVSEGANPLTEKVDQQPDLHAWYKFLTETVIVKFKPPVRGAIMADVKFAPGGIESVAFSRYSYEIPFRRSAAKENPPAQEPESNEAKLRESILQALMETASESQLAIPEGVNSVEVKLVFAGDPDGQKGSWTNTLVDPM